MSTEKELRECHCEEQMELFEVDDSEPDQTEESDQ